MIKNLLSKFMKPKKINLAYSTDIHSHLLPNIDDGVNTLEQSIEIIKKLQELGFEKLITTPHIMSHRFPNTKQSIKYAYDLVKNELVKQKIDIDLQYAAEYYFDEYFLDLIEKNDLLTFGDNFILFELSYHNKPLQLEQAVYKLIKNGYKPVLAHPERYRYYSTNDDYRRLKDMGLYFQINSISTEGFYGKTAKKSVSKIIDLSYVDFIGSDIHNSKYFDSYKKSLNNKLYNYILNKNNIKNNII